MGRSWRPAADAIVVNGVVRTLDAAGTVAAAVAIKDGRVQAVGSDHELAALKDRRTRVIDARGGTVLPGFTDCHTHFSVGTLARHLFINWEGDRAPRRLADALDDVRERAAVTPKGRWIRAAGLSESELEERRSPTRWEIDQVAPDHPVMLAGLGNHFVCANSAALALAGIDRDTDDPPGGRIERAADGEPTGVLREMAKLRLDYHHPEAVLEEIPVRQRIDLLERTIPELHAAGVTGIHDIVVDPLEVESWIRMRTEGRLRVRVRLLVRGIETRTPYQHLLALGLASGLGDEWLRFGGVKLSIDGICIYRAAAVYEPYPGEPDNYGFVRIPQDELDECVRQCQRHGIQMAVHAVGPRAVDMAIVAFDRAFEGRPHPERRHRIEHAYLPGPAGQLERIRDLGLVVSVQPGFVDKLGDAWVELLGEPSLKGIMPLRTMLDLGIPLIGGSDYPTIWEPFRVLRCATARRTPSGRWLDPAEAITLDEAVRLETSAAAFGSFEEQLKGTLEPGKLADLVVVTGDPWALPPERLDETKVDLTMVGGEVVFER